MCALFRGLKKLAMLVCKFAFCSATWSASLPEELEWLMHVAAVRTYGTLQLLHGVGVIAAPVCEGR